MIPDKHQIHITKKALKIFRKYMLVYLACEERVGKTLPAIMIAEIVPLNRILILTKKKPIKGWLETLEAYDHNKNYHVTNYHQASKLKNEDYDLVILDEAHNYISGFPKMSSMWVSVRRLTKGKPLIYLSATPFAQGYHLLYHQFKLSDWSPWKNLKNGYAWFEKYGIPETIWLQGREVMQYKKSIPEAYSLVQHLFVTYTRKKAGFTVEPENKLHYIELNSKTKQAYNLLTKERALIINSWELVCDTVGKLRTALHMLEGGVVLVHTPPEKGRKHKKANYVQLGNTEKIDYIKQHFGDSGDVVIMYHYIAEGIKLNKHFKNATILQATTFAEGIDLWQYKHLVIYSQDWSTARYTQRRARQANRKRDTAIIVHYLLVKNGISEEAYLTVAVNKKNYVDSMYQGNLL